MACGTPALVSTAGSLPEIVGSGEYTCSPEDPAELSEKIYQLHNSDMHRIARRWSLDQSQKFSWNTCAEEVIRIYGQIVQ
jgi:glycosyltransferase involved in cell wall biosynthesis